MFALTTPLVAAPAPATAPAAAADVDTSLVPGLRLPRVPGLPDARTPGISLGKLAAPPALGSIAARADMDAVKGAQLLRTPEGDAWAVRMAEDGMARLWFDLARRHRADSGLVAGWLDTALLASGIAANAAVTAIAKRRYDRDRPYVVDPTIRPPVRLPHDDSYPSGHTSGAYAAARVISVLAPGLAAEAYGLAEQVAVSRVYAGVHFPSDVIAGALLGTSIADATLRAAGRRPGGSAAS